MATRLKHATLLDRSGKTVYNSEAALQNKVTLLYFSAEWCPPCKMFTPLVKQFYEKAKAKYEKIEIVFVSNDKSEAEMLSYFQNHHGDYLAIKYGDEAHRELPRELKIEGIPTISVVDKNGKEVVKSGTVRQAILDGATGTKDVSDIILEWRKASGDWTASGGKVLNSNNVSPAKLSRDEMRAARLARFSGGAKKASSSSSEVLVKKKAVETSSDVKTVNVDNYNKNHGDDNSNKKVEQQSDGLQQLISMGFSEVQSKQMLEITNGDVQNAIALLTS
jgi:nucleoredoxin